MTQAYTPTLKAIAMGIDTRQEPVVYMRRDCHICQAEGFTSYTRLLIRAGGRALYATLNVVEAAVMPPGYIGFSEIARQQLGVADDDEVTVAHAPVVDSLRAVRKKIYNQPLDYRDYRAIIGDIVARRYTDVEIASFLTACAGERMNPAEIVDLTRAMVDCGEKLDWNSRRRVFDKHCIGGLAGNRTTPIVISICSAAGLLMPKTSSRAITSPAGTADTMEVLTRVNLSLDEMRATVHATNACLAWGGSVNLSPADDLLIRIERALDIDGEGQLVASVLSKKIAAGSTDILIDVPVGPTAKVRSERQAEELVQLFEQIARDLDVRVRCVITDGRDTVGFGVGPAEEARDLLTVLQCEAQAPQDLRERALLLSAHLLNMADKGSLGKCTELARELLDSGRAWQQFMAICNAQGGMKSIPTAAHHHTLVADRDGHVAVIDNRRLSRLAKLAGAPFAVAAGLRLHAKRGARIQRGEPLFTLHAASLGELAYALNYYRNNSDLITLEPCA